MRCQASTIWPRSWLRCWATSPATVVRRPRDARLRGVTTLDRREGDPAWSGTCWTRSTARAGTATYQVVLGGRPVGSESDFLQGKQRVTVGEVDGWV